MLKEVSSVGARTEEKVVQKYYRSSLVNTHKETVSLEQLHTGKKASGREFALAS